MAASTGAPASLPGAAERARVLAAPVLVGAGAAVLTALVRSTGGSTAFPVCPLHATTGLWCPFCGGLRCVAALTRGDLSAAASSNAVVVLLLPLIALGWLASLRAAWRGLAWTGPRVSRRAWVVVSAVLAVFTVWRNLPQLPWGQWLAP